jgi:hypothetical protein
MEKLEKVIGGEAAAILEGERANPPAIKAEGVDIEAIASSRRGEGIGSPSLECRRKPD